MRRYAQICCAAIALLAGACNTVLGVEDVAQLPPDAAVRQPPDAPPDAPPDCKASPDYPLIKSPPLTAVLSRRSDGGPSLVFLLNNDAKPDLFLLLLFNNMGGHGVLNAVGTYSLTAADAKQETCGICVALFADVDRTTLDPDATFFAIGQGTLTVTRSDTAGMAGQLQNLRLRHVDITTSVTREISDSCMVTVEDVQFDLSYSP